MKNTAYLEKYNGYYLDDFVYSSEFILKNKKGFKIMFFNENTRPEKIEKYDIIVGSVTSAMPHVLSLCPNYSWETYPKELESFLYRNIKKDVLKNYKENYYPAFIKPVKTKEFTGFYCKQYLYLSFVNEVPEDTEIYISEEIDFLSEWRVFVHNSKVVGVGNYSGDPLNFPSKAIVTSMIDSYALAPISYALDVGIDSRGHTALVETNDAFSTGSYGIDPFCYVNWMLDRWKQLSNSR